MGNRRAVLIALALAAAAPAGAGEVAPAMVWTGTAPSGACKGQRAAIDVTTGKVYACPATTWSWTPPTWTEVAGKPSTFAPSAHSHVGGDVTSAVATASALAANPTNCGAGQKASGVAADGTAEGCSAVPSTAAAGASGVIQVSNGGGGLFAYAGTGAAPANQWIQSLDGSGAGTWAQPAFSNLTGSASSAQLPTATSGAQGAVLVPASACNATTEKAVWNGSAFVCGTDQTGGGGGGISPLTVRTFGGF